MKLGIATNLTWFGAPVVEVAKKVEALGFESLFMGEHIIIPVDIANGVRHGAELPPNYRHMPNPFVWLTAAAVSTTTLRLGFDICLVPQRNPLILAKEVASLDRISNGRVVFGAGIGWIEEEAEIMGVHFKTRWARTMESLRALKTLWTEEQPSFAGEFINFPAVYSYPKPVQTPHVPILIGAGNANTKNRSPILKRVVEVGDGWLPAFLTPEQIGADLRELKGYCDEAGRDFAALDITLIVPAVHLGVGEAFASMGTIDRSAAIATRDMIARYEAAGVTRIIVGMVDMTEETYVEALETAAAGLGLSGAAPQPA